MTEYQGVPTGAGRRVCIVVSRFNLLVTERLLEGARARLVEVGVREDDLDILRVPGAWELPWAARRAAREGYDAIVALGCVVRGETPHFDFVSRAALDGLRAVMSESGTPIGLGVLTADTMAQAMARAGGEVGNAGVQAVDAALELADLDTRLGTRGGER